MENKQIKSKIYEAQFHTTFKKPLGKFMHPLFGFDIIEFDHALNTPDGTSTHDFVEDKYGKEAGKLIETLIQI